MTRQMAGAQLQAEQFPVVPGHGAGVRTPGGENLLAEMYDQHGSRIYRYLLALLGNRADAEDTLQSTFLELARRPDALARIQSPGAYLFTVARRNALRLRQRSQNRKERETDGVDLLEARPMTAVDPAETERLGRAVLALPVEQREVLVLKAFEEMTFLEIAESLEISPNTAASRYRYAVEKLRTLLGGDAPASA